MGMGVGMAMGEGIRRQILIIGDITGTGSSHLHLHRIHIRGGEVEGAGIRIRLFMKGMLVRMMGLGCRILFGTYPSPSGICWSQVEGMIQQLYSGVSGTWIG